MAQSPKLTAGRRQRLPARYRSAALGGLTLLLFGVVCLSSTSAVPAGRSDPAPQLAHHTGKADKKVVANVDDRSLEMLGAAFTHIDKRDWKRARAVERRIPDPFARKLALWGRLSAPGAPAELGELTGFVHYNPQWPRLNRILNKTEAQLSAKGGDGEVLAWFRHRQPRTTLGRARLGEALLRRAKPNDRERGLALIREAWIKGNFSKADERRFIRRHGRRFGPKDHIARLDRLLWEGRYWPVRRHLWRVPKSYQALGQARISLRRQQGNVDRLVAAVPKNLQRDPGLIYERLRWRRIKGKKTALDLVRHLPGTQPYPEKWWNERAVLVRRALRRGFVTDAYRIARNHGLTEGGDYAEAEWLAGWVALRFLQEPRVGLQHFERMFAKVSFPISRARGAYWVARAHAALGQSQQAQEWHRRAARHPTTYYGQLSLAEIDQRAVLNLPPEIEPAPEIKRRFEAHELTRAYRMLVVAGASKHLRPMLKALYRRADEHPDWRALTARLAAGTARPDLAISVAKLAAQTGQILSNQGYPSIRLPRLPVKWQLPRLEKPLILSMIRQESLFHPKAISRARAQGLMQIMPATARLVAKRHGLRYSKKRLLTDPAYNMTLGQSYLGGLLRDFEGSYVLSIASYNAGPHRVRGWIKQFGDPRESDVDVIDWVEMIPFDETRNYVQRVMENLHIYRSRLAETEVALAPHDDLLR